MNKKNDVLTRERSLDALWQAARALGRVQVNGGMFEGRSTETVTIEFERASGSTIRAKATATTIHDAIDNAIAEALELGAKP